MIPCRRVHNHLEIILLTIHLADRSYLDIDYIAPFYNLNSILFMIEMGCTIGRGEANRSQTVLMHSLLHQ